MDQKEMNEQVGKMLSDNPAKYIKIRGILDEMFEGRTLEGSKDISDREFERLRYRFRDIDVPLSFCVDKEAAYQLQKAVKYHRGQSRSRYDDRPAAKKSAKAKKKGLFGIFG
ncbi:MULTISPECIES: hypothetical protein [Schaedlerella]|uniref:hypothetical protein n=1 Tax=Schaedlerella TaxID=2676048 RepID=UPI0013646F09|nr:hypothetical protein [Schaedlerella arabinosiphila]MCI8769424.1 hypothetical protein [Ruminococcus sp.]NBJ01224.1 hypothetical protein [Lachnospiraceae bacterium]